MFIVISAFFLPPKWMQMKAHRRLKFWNYTFELQKRKNNTSLWNVDERNIIKTSIDFRFFFAASNFFCGTKKERKAKRKKNSSLMFFMTLFDVLRRFFSPFLKHNKFYAWKALMYGIRTSCKPHGLIFVTQMISHWKSKFNLNVSDEFRGCCFCRGSLALTD